MTAQHGPVVLVLTGARHDVAALLYLLEQVSALSDVSEPMPSGAYDVRVSATVTRRHPLTGGPK
ncbi:hypothetical protein Cme02nite_20780 [Catellatospora methionotrophica]|uniref:Uncharacterized protein n=1 Tax=Catellatospora methionotrophica TaxID=121620 RepID=A0A8J3LEM7_9ACTN|nr:hypothetical protein [Catellatospora methionotrophica]GIG13746.1 hypothetical protein Cme02nite_20780 [Catellatospora methionotrophica]